MLPEPVITNTNQILRFTLVSLFEVLLLCNHEETILREVCPTFIYCRAESATDQAH